MRTSDTHAIRVDFLTRGDLDLPGRIGLTFAPGKKDYEWHWDRDLDVDLRRLREHYSVDCLVSLMEAPEYTALHIAGLPERAATYGLTRRWFPIRDLAAPPARSMRRFLNLIQCVIEDVRAGRTVVVYCRGGMGRSGLVAASCLVACGYGATEAIRRVRSARSEAVDVATQERWVEMVAQTTRGKRRWRSLAEPRSAWLHAEPR
jgi:protein-tyrosine phosphatase